jgi:hypothetical protein
MWNVWVKQSICWILLLVLMLAITTSVTANAPQPPFLYWLKFDSPAKLQGVQIGQCYVKSCHKLALLKQYGTCDRSGCIKSAPKLKEKKPLGLECANNLCLVSLSPFYDRKELDPTQLRVRTIIQINSRSRRLIKHSRFLQILKRKLPNHRYFRIYFYFSCY